jgi:uncharacterized protein YukJ
MAFQYTVLAGKAVDRRFATAKKNHYEIHIRAAGEDYRIAVNVQSVDKSEVLYFVDPNFSHPLLAQLVAVPEGHQAVAQMPGGIALDYVRGGYVQQSQMLPLPISVPGDDNDLNDKIDALVQRAMNTEGAVVYAFGSFFKDPPNKKDEYFGFKPSQGIHDVHMNQGNDPGHSGDDGVFHDGALLFHYPSRNQWAAVFLAFQNQSWITDDATGHATTKTMEKPKPMPVDRPAGALRIVAAVANSIEDPEIETVTLLNASPQSVDLAGWVLADKNKNSFALNGSVSAGATLRVKIAKPMELSNKGGIITLLDAAGAMVDGVTYTKTQAAKPGWTIKF